MTAREDRNQRPEGHAAPGDGGPAEAARLVARSTGELAQLSRRHKLDMLAHLLEMAQMEADEIARRNALTRL